MSVCVCACLRGDWLLTSTIVFLISALGNIFLRTVDPPCGAFRGEKRAHMCASVCTYTYVLTCVYSVCVCVYE